MIRENSQLSPGVITCVAPTGRGESAIFHALGLGNHNWGYNSYCAFNDKPCCWSMQQDISSFPDDNKILGIHLDSLKTPSSRTRVANLLNQVTVESEITVFLFGFPETYISPTFKWEIHQAFARSVFFSVLDKFHLYVMFGATFRPSFHKMKEFFFKHHYTTCKDTIKMKIPIIILSATATVEGIELLSKMTGLPISGKNLYWCTPKEIQRRNIKLKFTYSLQFIKHAKLSLYDVMSDNKYKQTIIYTNSREKLKILWQLSMTGWIIIPRLLEVLLTLMVMGPWILTKKSSRHHFYVQSWCWRTSVSKWKISMYWYFYSRICWCGVWCSQCTSSCKAWIINIITWFFQEMGRTGRGWSLADSLSYMDAYKMIGCLYDYVYLIERMY